MIKILKISRFGCGGKDSVIWNFKDGEIFSVKSDYNLVVLLKDNNVASSFMSLLTSMSFWTKYWKINLPNKIKIFLWRMLQNIILTK